MEHSLIASMADAERYFETTFVTIKSGGIIFFDRCLMQTQLNKTQINSRFCLFNYKEPALIAL